MRLLVIALISLRYNHSLGGGTFPPRRTAPWLSPPFVNYPPLCSGSRSPVRKVSKYFCWIGSAPDIEDADEDIPDILTNLDINDGPFTAAELAKVKATLQQGKSAGPDGIPPEVFKNCEIDIIILKICNLALINNEVPSQWSLANIIPVPKIGDLGKTDNYRGISLTCIIANMFNRMILNRLRSAIDPHLRDNQNGFRERRSTTSHILALRRIIEEVKSNNLTAILTFIDRRKAFDSIHRGKMVKILKAYGVPTNLLRATQSMYSGTRSKVVTPDGNTDEFDILAGVMQGDTLAPFIFIVVLDFALRRAISGHNNNNNNKQKKHEYKQFTVIAKTKL